MKTGTQLQELASKRDMKSAVANFQYGFSVGQVWSFWLEDDPRTESGIYPISQFRCVSGGNLESSQWERIEGAK